MAALTVVYSRRWLSERWLGDWWTHCGLLCLGGTVLASSWRDGVTRRSIGEFLDRTVHLGHRDIEVPNPTAGMDWANAQIGRYGLRSAEFVEGVILAAGLSRFHGSLRRVSPSQSFQVR